MPKYLACLIMLAATPLCAQTLTCNANAGIPPLIRSEGRAETLGDVVIDCASTSTAAPAPFDLVVTTNAPITSRITGAGGITEALLLLDLLIVPTVDEPNRPIQKVQLGVNAFQGILTSANTLLFKSVKLPVLPRAESVHAMRITNVRVDASTIPPSPTLIPAQVFVTTSFVSGGHAINNPQQTTAFIRQSLAFETRAAQGGTATPTFTGCGPNNASVTTGAPATLSYQLAFREGFQTAFKRRTEAEAQNVPGVVYNTESNFFDTTLPTANGLNVAGSATQGTRVMAKFSNIPAGVSLYVSVNRLGMSTSDANLVSADVNGAGPMTSLPATVTPTIGGTPVGMRQLTLTNGAAQAVWEVTAANAAVIDELIFGVVVSYPSLGSFGTVNMTGSYAPLSTSGTASETEPVPRFHHPPIGATAIFKACVAEPVVMVETLSVPPTAVDPTPFKAIAVVRNTGAAPAGPFDVTFRMFRDEKLTAAAAGPFTCVIANGLAVGASASCAVTLPSNVKATDYDEAFYVTATVGPNRLIQRVSATECWASSGGYGTAKFSGVGGLGSFRVSTANATCSWTASASAPWITLHKSSGTGPETVTYSVEPNPGGARAGSVNVSGDAWGNLPVGVEQARSADEPATMLRMHRNRSAVRHFIYEVPSTLTGGHPVDSMTILLSNGVNGANACMVQYNPQASNIRLMADNGTSWLGPLNLGVAGKLSNSQCTVHGVWSRARSSVPAANGPKHVLEVAVEPTRSNGLVTMYGMITSATAPFTTEWTNYGMVEFDAGVFNLIDVRPRAVETDYVVLESELSTLVPESQYLTYLLLLPTPNVVQFTAKGSCLVEYNRISNGIRLVNDAGIDWHGPISGVPIAANAPQLSNSTCTVDVARAMHDSDGAGRSILRIPIRMKSALGRTVTTFIQAFDVLGNFTDMRQFGMVKNIAGGADAPGPHASASVLAMNGTKMTAQAKFTHDGGLGQIVVAHVRVTDTIVSNGACHIVYFPPANTINLVNGTQFVGPDRTPGTTGTLSNSACSFNLSEVSVAKSTDLTLTIPITLIGWPEQRRLYVNAFDMKGLLTHWVDGGVGFLQYQ